MDGLTFWGSSSEMRRPSLSLLLRAASERASEAALREERRGHEGRELYCGTSFIIGSGRDYTPRSLAVPRRKEGRKEGSSEVAARFIEICSGRPSVQPLDGRTDWPRSLTTRVFFRGQKEQA